MGGSGKGKGRGRGKGRSCETWSCIFSISLFWFIGRAPGHLPYLDIHSLSSVIVITGSHPRKYMRGDGYEWLGTIANRYTMCIESGV